MFFGKNLSIPSEERWGLRFCILGRLTLGTARPLFQRLLSHLRRAQQKPDLPRFPTSPIELTYQKHSPPVHVRNNWRGAVPARRLQLV